MFPLTIPKSLLRRFVGKPTPTKPPCCVRSSARNYKEKNDNHHEQQDDGPSGFAPDNNTSVPVDAVQGPFMVHTRTTMTGSSISNTLLHLATGLSPRCWEQHEHDHNVLHSCTGSRLRSLSNPTGKLHHNVQRGSNKCSTPPIVAHYAFTMARRTTSTGIAHTTDSNCPVSCRHLHVRSFHKLSHGEEQKSS